MSFDFDLPPPDPLRDAVAAAYRTGENRCVEGLLDELVLAPESRSRISARAGGLVAAVRGERVGRGGLDAFLHEYALTSQEGVVLMCLAEALLRVPDADTADRLIREKLGSGDWETHLGRSDSLLVNASTWALLLTGRMVRLGSGEGNLVKGAVGRLVARSGEPFVRQAVVQAMRILGRQFVMGRTIAEALERAREGEAAGYRHSYDMLGEAASTAADADRHRAAYEQAIAALAEAGAGLGPVAGPEISVKLSALHPRVELAQRRRVRAELLPVLTDLAAASRRAEIGFIIDAEEAARLEVSLDLVEALALDERLAGWDGLGLAVQAYAKRALPLVEWLADLARRGRRRLKVRLVKGAYWDTEIKRAQEQGLADYPVFTRKANTDVSYLAAARRLLAAPDRFYPQFATHNAHTLAAVYELAGESRDYEFQCLHGMGTALYDHVVGADKMDRACRVYAPVGRHEDLLAYLVRRLLENGANTSFVNRIVDERAPIEEITADPVAAVRGLADKRHPRIPLPADLFGPERRNSSGIDLGDPTALRPLAPALGAAGEEDWRAAPLVDGEEAGGAARPVYGPADRRLRIGDVVDADPAAVEHALAAADAAFPAWAATPAEARAACLDRMADLLERDRTRLLSMLVLEAGKTLPDALAEVREAVDFCRYYAMRADIEFAAPARLPGPTGEDNALSLHGRGVFACISPWNFPLAIFCGQIAAALAAGNAVVAKPAEQTPLIGHAAVRMLHEAGVPGRVLSLLPGDGSVGARIVGDPRIGGVAFTGSTETARAINRALAARDGPIVPLIAETGGQNAMLVDSTALPEQVIADVLASAFQSAGQRCSALRVLFVQADIGDRLIDMLEGAMAELRVGDPGRLDTDVGPVIDADALAMLEAHADRMRAEGRLIREVALGEETGHGTFFAPRAYEIDRLARLEGEVFGPILHVIRYRAEDLDRVVDEINATGYGLTLGIHSRIDETVDRIRARARVGNTYVNRNQIGAMVGSQPFGGERLSGTGPKAGGPRYLHRFATERVVAIDTTARGGNALLLSLAEEEDPGAGERGPGQP